jgi:hypothetical protein
MFLCTGHISDVPSGNCSVFVQSTLFWCNEWKLLYFCAECVFLMYRLETVHFLCIVNISDIKSGNCVFVHSAHFWCFVWNIFCFCAQYTFLDVTSWNCCDSVHSTQFWSAVWKMFCFYAQYTFLIHRLEMVLFLCTVHINDMPSGKCSLSVLSTYFWCTALNVFCFCAQYTFFITVLKLLCFCAQYSFLMYRLESVLFLCTILISDGPPGKCSISVHSKHFTCTVLKVFFFLRTVHISDVLSMLFCFCAQYTFLMYRLESVLFLYTVRISDIPTGKCCVSVHSTHFWCTVWEMKWMIGSNDIYFCKGFEN